MTSAHAREVIGKYSEVIARAALMANGFEVAMTETEEPYDFIAKDPVSGRWATFQCKTIRIRHDRAGEFVVYATNGMGERYCLDDVDYFIAVLAENGETPRVYYFENRGLREYWASEKSASERWVELPIALDRTLFEEEDNNDTLLAN